MGFTRGQGSWPVRAIVTGASGFVGRHLTRELRRSMEVVEPKGDVRSPEFYAALPKADVVYHLAAQSNVPQSTREPAGTWDVNANGTLRLLEWARSQEVGRVVLVSTAHVYGRTERALVDETHPTRPVSPYGASKLAAEALVQSYQATYGLAGVVVRPFNMYGPGQGPGFLIPDVLAQLRAGRELLVGDTSPVRDFTYIDDAVAMLAKAGTVPAASGMTMNLGSGVGHAVRDVIETAIRVSGSKLRPQVDEKRLRPVDVPELVVDNRRAREVLGWRPMIGLEEGLRRTWAAFAEDKA